MQHYHNLSSFGLMAVIIQNTRLIIREYLPDEEELFIALLTDARVTAYLPKRNAEENRKIFRDTLTEYQQGIKLARWGIFNHDGEYIGFAMLKNTGEDITIAELGYVIHDELKGTGLATEVSIALIDYGFEVQQLNQIIAVTVPENIASRRVLEKAGMMQGENMIRNGMSLSYFSISNNEWPAKRL